MPFHPLIDSFDTGPKNLPVEILTTIVVKGVRFSQTAGPVRVKLVDTQGFFVWDPEEKFADAFISSTEVHVNSTPHATGKIDDKRGGSGDLTITVTNGDGVVSLATPVDSINYV